MTQMSASINEGGTIVPLSSNLAMSAADTATILNAIMNVMQNDINVYTQQLGAM